LKAEPSGFGVPSAPARGAGTEVFMSAWVYASLLGVSISLASACSSSDQGTSGPADSSDPPSTLKPPTVTATVDLRGGSPEPPSVTLKAGEAVRFLWSDTTEHSLVSGADCTPDGGWQVLLTKPPPEIAGPSDDGNRSFVMVYEEAGIFDYFCEAHCPGNEVGRIIVE
jgi:plastocyanin